MHKVREAPSKANPQNSLSLLMAVELPGHPIPPSLDAGRTVGLNRTREQGCISQAVFHGSVFLDETQLT